ncbi:trimeric intracellular cation channel family protein [Streptomyces sp. NPDC000348]|uniref:trimeric intracellular cation channel family protein n=1 Tax=Streptomyces sp. NPDC000348 TaxID=3364538 RepID=UPI00368967E2
MSLASMMLMTASTQYVLDLLGIFAFALSGAHLSVRKDFDLFGTVVVAEASGLGGGLMRDLVLDVPSIAFTDPGYPLAPLTAALLTYFGKPLQREPYLFHFLDAMALGLFCVTGTIKALQHGMPVVPAAALGVGTAVGGGVLASVVSRELPPIMRWDADLYAVPAIIGAATVSVLHGTGSLDVNTATLAATGAFGLRLLAMHFHWRLPRSTAWRVGFGHAHAAATAPVRQGTPPPAILHRPAFDHNKDTLRLRLPDLPGQTSPRQHGHAGRTARHQPKLHQLSHRR